MAKDKKSGAGEIAEGLKTLGKAAGAVGGEAGKLIGATGRAGGGAANGALGLVGKTINVTGNIIINHPKISLVATAYVGGKLLEKAYKKHKANKENATVQEQVGEVMQEENNAQQVADAGEHTPISRESPQENVAGLMAQIYEAMGEKPPENIDRWAEQVIRDREAQGPSHRV